MSGDDGGGALALWAATVSPRIHAASAVYPARILWRLEGIRPEAHAGGDTALHLAADDPEFGPADTRRLQRSVGAGRRLTIHTYPRTRRGFLNESRPDRCDDAAAELVWERIRARATVSGAADRVEEP